MSLHDRKEAEEQLTSLLNRALKNVPLVKLDAVDDVLKLFTEAIDLMESNQVLEEEDRTAAPPTSAIDSRQSNLLALAGNFSTATTATNSGASSASSSDTEREELRASGGGPIVNKALASAALTVDYSSPSSKTRSLGAKSSNKESARPAGSTGLGLGLGKGSGGGSSNSLPKQLGLHGGHKPSSRATTGLNALNPGSSPVSPTTPDTSSDENIAGFDGVLKNKHVAKIAGAPSNREYPSPKLGPRSLGGTPKPAPVNLPVQDALGRDAAPAPAPTTPDADDDQADEEPDEAEAGDLILTDKKNSVFNRVKSTLPVTASPKQIRSSFHLLELATTHSLQQEDDDLTLQPQGGDAAAATNGAVADRPAGTTGVLSALPTGLQTSSTTNTPKPSYLRRLDSPETHHGQLLAAKARLQLLINKGIQLADRVDLAAVPEVKAKLQIALAKLEASLVQTTLGQ